MIEFVKVSKNLEIKGLLTNIEIDDQTASYEERNEPENISTDVEDDVEDPGPPLNEDDSLVVASTKTFIPLVRSKTANKGVIIKTEGNRYVCNECDFEGKHRINLYRHRQSVHRRVKYDCNQCNYQTTRQDSLSEHIRSVHEGVKYACNQCDYQATQQSNLTTHIKSQHEGVKYA